VSAELELIEQIIDASGAPGRIEALLPAGVRPRQLTARTLLIGMTLTMLDGRDALLTGVLRSLLRLGEADQLRLGVIVDRQRGPHRLTYRQLEYTYRLIATSLAKNEPDGAPSETLSAVLDELLEASVTVLGQPGSNSYAVDWTDLETWARPPPKPAADPQPAATTTADPQHPPPRERRSDPEAAWGHRNTNHPAKSEIFYGYYLQALTTVKDEHGPEVPELARRIHLASCNHDPPAQIIPVIKRMHHDDIPICDLLADSGYSYRQPQTFALPLRALGTQLIIDLHPNDRGPNGTHMGAICANGQLYCPATPTTLLALQPLAHSATDQQTDAHDQQTRELARYKLAPITGHDHDGYHRVSCPAAQQKLRCPHRPASMTLPHNRPTIHQPPQHPPACCTQKTITVPPTVNAKTAQKHDYPSPAHRRSYNRRTAAERTFATLTNRATNDLSRGWCRLFGLAPTALFTATALIARNIRTTDAFAARQADPQHRAQHALQPKRRRRRRTTHDLINAANQPP